jgi:hypothetical protein
MQRAELIGCWELCSTEPPADFGERVQMEFAPSGMLTYAFLEQGSWKVMFLSFRIEGDELVTDQPSAPQEERSAFALCADGRRKLGFGGVESIFERVSDVSFGRVFKMQSSSRT